MQLVLWKILLKPWYGSHSFLYEVLARDNVMKRWFASLFVFEHVSTNTFYKWLQQDLNPQPLVLKRTLNRFIKRSQFPCVHLVQFREISLQHSSTFNSCHRPQSIRYNVDEDMITSAIFGNGIWSLWVKHCGYRSLRVKRWIVIATVISGAANIHASFFVTLFFSSSSMLLNFFINWASNVA